MLVRASDPGDVALAPLVWEIVNAAYRIGEANLFKNPDAKDFRTSESEVRQLLSDGRLILAFQDDGALVGSVMVATVEEEQGRPVGEVGMLAVRPGLWKQGVGRKLMAAAEDWAKSQGCTDIQLFLLSPVEWESVEKAKLLRWYVRLGYEKQDELPFPRLDDLACPCRFESFRKRIAVGA